MIGIQKIPRRICWTLKIACCSFRRGDKGRVQLSPFWTPFMCWIFVSTKGIYMKPSEFGDVLKLKHSDWMDFLVFLQIWGLRPSFFFLRPSRWPCHIAAPNGDRLKNEFAQSQTLRTKKSQVELDWCESCFFRRESEHLGTKTIGFLEASCDPPGRYVRVLSKNSATAYPIPSMYGIFTYTCGWFLW